MFLRFIAIVWAVLVGLTVEVRPAGAQTTTGTILGTIKDTTGGALPGVTVTAVNRSNGTMRKALTDATASERFLLLRPLEDRMRTSIG
jgi:hypothetical protein